ncbi:MAG TPA: oxidoreductase, partial [Hyphomonadaceae bacterium]|nr:oxidoreductase [Hyphomonadaceae bacterium]
DTAAAAASGAEIVLLCLGADPDVRAMVEAITPVLAAGALVIDHTTASAALARALAAELGASGVDFLDAPVSGGQAGAQNAALAIMVGGEAGAFARAEPILRVYGKSVQHIGPAGHGQLAKMVNQIAIAGVVQGLAEALAFGDKACLDMDKVLSVIAQGAAGSWQMNNRAKTMLADQFNFGFAVDWMRKDLDYALAEARANGAALPLAALVDQFYAQIQAQGGGRWDTSSLIRRLRAPPSS